MIALISPAKTMCAHRDSISPAYVCTQPRFLKQTHELIAQMVGYSSTELEQIFKISLPLALELKHRFDHFHDPTSVGVPALASYDGVVFKHFKEDEFQVTQLDYLQDHIRISSFLYGLLRPLDLIKPYRMEPYVRLEESGMRVDQFWRSIQTSQLIEDVQEAGGVLLYLASKEEQKAFHWKEVLKQVRVIDFQFLQYKGDQLRQVVVYTKMARGEMIRYMMKNQITNPEALKGFEWEGYRYREDLSQPDVWVWVME